MAHGDVHLAPQISKAKATELLGTMVGGYNVKPLIDLLDDAACWRLSQPKVFKKTLLMFDFFHDVAEKAKAANPVTTVGRTGIVKSWADAEWFTTRPEVPNSIKLTVLKVTGETNTDDLSPAPDAWSRPDIPLHALAMLKNTRPGITPEDDGEARPDQNDPGPRRQGQSCRLRRRRGWHWLVTQVGNQLRAVVDWRRHPLTYQTRNSVASASVARSLNLFFNTQEDAGALAIELDVSKLDMGDEIELTVDHATGAVKVLKGGAVVSESALKNLVLLDEVRAGGRINLIIGRSLTAKAREFLGQSASTLFRLPQIPADTGKGYTLAQKMVGRACGLPEGKGMRPGTYCEPKMTSVGSQDTTGPMTRDELKDLACLGFSADLVMQSFCHTAAYPKPVDVKTHRELPKFIANRGGISLRPGDGIIHSWLNRMLMPDTVGTGGDSHTRFPVGISFPGRLRAGRFRGRHRRQPATRRPESVLVRFKGTMQPGVTLRDLVHAIPLYAIKEGPADRRQGGQG